ncbi:hypothetical protein C2G38_117991 [Gigaspora rosea]|uniref:Uncharacterized protein n=1 Tax=Gigaspora rosea TaxID=44941 RepID=A0A397UVS9_9GLOM|nr:hypothetical protein C2G38_117991 [Gigaspora rosea]
MADTAQKTLSRRLSVASTTSSTSTLSGRNRTHQGNSSNNASVTNDQNVPDFSWQQQSPVRSTSTTSQKGPSLSPKKSNGNLVKKIKEGRTDMGLLDTTHLDQSSTPPSSLNSILSPRTKPNRRQPSDEQNDRTDSSRISQKEYRAMTENVLKIFKDLEMRE